MKKYNTLISQYYNTIKKKIKKLGHLQFWAKKIIFYLFGSGIGKENLILNWMVNSCFWSKYQF